MKRRVVISGMGVVTSLSRRLDDLFERLCRGESGIRPLQRPEAARLPVRFGGEIPDWTTDGYLPPKDGKRMDRFAQFALVSAIDAARDSGVDFDRENPFRCGVIFGSGIGGLEETESQYARLMEKGPEKVSCFLVPKMIANAASGQISIHLGLQGPSGAVVTACASGADAIAQAFKAIQYGDAEIMIAGGAEASLTPLAISGFASMGALSTRHDAPTAASRPFDADRNGFVMSEGSGALVLEELQHAKARGARIYAELLGCGRSSDAHHIAQPHKDGVGAASAMRAALLDACAAPQDVGYINAHGTSTPLGDLAETTAIKAVFGPHAARLPVSSTKSQLGHLIGAAGAVELIVSVLTLNKGMLPPTINYEKPDPGCDLDYVPNTARAMACKIAMSNSFGFGGHNSSLIVGQLRNGAAH